MRKIPTLFIRDPETRLVIDEVTPGCEWVPAGEGTAHAKWDGTACLIRDGRLYKRYDAKRGKVPPSDFEPAQEPDPVTGHWPGWMPVGDGPEDRWHREAWLYFGNDAGSLGEADGTYELVGPKVQGNPYGWSRHGFIGHTTEPLTVDPRAYSIIRDWLSMHGAEGIVWHHPDGRMAKIKRRDFGLPWPVRPR